MLHWCAVGSFPESPHRLARPRTPPFHGDNRGSNPLGDATSRKYSIATGRSNTTSSVEPWRSSTSLPRDSSTVASPTALPAAPPMPAPFQLRSAMPPMDAPLPARIAMRSASLPRVGSLLHHVLFAGYLLAGAARIHRAQVRSELHHLALCQGKGLQPDGQLGSSGDAAAALGLRNHTLHVAAHRHNDVPVRADGAGRSQIDIIAFLRRASTQRVLHAEQQVSALGISAAPAAAERTLQKRNVVLCHMNSSPD